MHNIPEVPIPTICYFGILQAWLQKGRKGESSSIKTQVWVFATKLILKPGSTHLSWGHAAYEPSCWSTSSVFFLFVLSVGRVLANINLPSYMAINVKL